MKFLGCYVDQQKVLCDVTYTLTKTDSGTFRLNDYDVKYYTAAGTTGTAAQTSVAGSDYGFQRGSSAVSGIPVKGTFSLPLSAGTKFVAALVIYDHRINNVFISQTGAPAMPAPVTTQPRPAAVPVPVPTTGAVNVTMTGCTITAGIITCTKAVIGPPR